MRGGKRPNAGRKPKTYETKSVTFYIKLEWEQELRELFKNFRKAKNEKDNQTLRIKEVTNGISSS